MAEYTTREMIDAIEVNPPVRNFLTKWFFPVERTHVTEKVEFDVKRESASWPRSFPPVSAAR